MSRRRALLVALLIPCMVVLVLGCFFSYGWDLGREDLRSSLRFNKTGKLWLIADNPCNLKIPLYRASGEFISEIMFTEGQAKTEIPVTTGETYILYQSSTFWAHKTWILIEIPDVSLEDLDEEYILVYMGEEF